MFLMPCENKKKIRLPQSLFDVSNQFSSTISFSTTATSLKRRYFSWFMIFFIVPKGKELIGKSLCFIFHGSGKRFDGNCFCVRNFWCHCFLTYTRPLNTIIDLRIFQIISNISIQFTSNTHELLRQERRRKLPVFFLCSIASKIIVTPKDVRL